MTTSWEWDDGRKVDVEFWGFFCSGWCICVLVYESNSAERGGEERWREIWGCWFRSRELMLRSLMDSASREAPYPHKMDWALSPSLCVSYVPVIVWFVLLYFPLLFKANIRSQATAACVCASLLWHLCFSVMSTSSRGIRVKKTIHQGLELFYVMYGYGFNSQPQPFCKVFFRYTLVYSPSLKPHILLGNHISQKCECESE